MGNFYGSGYSDKSCSFNVRKEELQRNIFHRNNIIKSNKDDIDSLTKQLNDLESKNKMFGSQTDRIFNENKVKNRGYSYTQIYKNTKLKPEEQRMIQIKEELFKIPQKIKRQQIQLQNQKDNLATFVAIQNQIANQKRKNYEFQQQRQKTLNLSNSEHEKLIRKKDQQISNLKRQIQNLQLKLFEKGKMQALQLNNIIRGKQESQKLLNKQLIRLNQQKYQYQKNILTMQKQLGKQKAVRHSFTNEIQSIKAQHSLQLSKQKAINFNLTSEIQRLRDQPPKASNMDRQQNLFNGNVLISLKQARQYLINILEQKIGSRISKTELIYRFDPQSKANFHQYFDNKQQLVLIVRTQNDFIFGGWTEGGFIPKAKSEKSGLLFSLTNQKCFELSKPNRKAITYDEFNIIFGNSEIVIQSLKDEVYSNFGIKNGFYNCGDYTVDLMLGAGDSKEAQIQTYEMFQLSFEK